MTERKEQIIHEAIQLIVTQGHAGLTMRAVARASGLKLGALQYHYPTRLSLIEALATWLGEETAANFEAYRGAESTDPRGLHALVDFLIDDPLADAFDLDTLFEQLWAMAHYEPPIRSLLDELYTHYLGFIEDELEALGVKTPRPEALVIMSMLEGLPLFVGKGRRWQRDAKASVKAIHRFLEARFGAEV